MNTEKPEDSEQTPEPVVDQSLFAGNSEPDIDNNTNVDNEDDLVLEDLKNRARQLGLKFHPSIKAEALGAKIKEALENNASLQDTAVGGQSVSGQSERAKIKADALALVRVRITCMDPLKRNHQGEIFTTGNSLIGTVKRFVPFGVEWHIPKIMLNMLKEKEHTVYSSTKTNLQGIETTTSRFVKTYNIEILEPLTQKELAELARRQAMAQGKETAA